MLVTSKYEIIEKIKTVFQQLHDLHAKLSFLTQLNLLNSEYICKLDLAPDDIDIEEFNREGGTLQNLIRASN